MGIMWAVSAVGMGALRGRAPAEGVAEELLPVVGRSQFFKEFCKAKLQIKLKQVWSVGETSPSQGTATCCLSL
jgi:hypothetical protein